MQATAPRMARGRTAVASVGLVALATISSELEKLARLHGEGAITEDEFAAAQCRLLDR